MTDIFDKKKKEKVEKAKQNKIRIVTVVILLILLSALYRPTVEATPIETPRNLSEEYTKSHNFIIVQDKDNTTLLSEASVKEPIEVIAEKGIATLNKDKVISFNEINSTMRKKLNIIDEQKIEGIEFDDLVEFTTENQNTNFNHGLAYKVIAKLHLKNPYRDILAKEPTETIEMEKEFSLRLNPEKSIEETLEELWKYTKIKDILGIERDYLSHDISGFRLSGKISEPIRKDNIKKIELSLVSFNEI